MWKLNSTRNIKFQFWKSALRHSLETLLRMKLFLSSIIGKVKFSRNVFVYVGVILIKNFLFLLISTILVFYLLFKFCSNSNFINFMAMSHRLTNVAWSSEFKEIGFFLSHFRIWKYYDSKQYLAGNVC